MSRPWWPAWPTRPPASPCRCRTGCISAASPRPSSPPSCCNWPPSGGCRWTTACRSCCRGSSPATATILRGLPSASCCSRPAGSAITWTTRFPDGAGPGGDVAAAAARRHRAAARAAGARLAVLEHQGMALVRDGGGHLGVVWRGDEEPPAGSDMRAEQVAVTGAGRWRSCGEAVVVGIVPRGLSVCCLMACAACGRSRARDMSTGLCWSACCADSVRGGGRAFGRELRV